MTKRDATTTVFRELAVRSFDFLSERGFARAPEDELDTPVGTSVVFAGRHVGFIIGWDARDRVVEVRVTRARRGRLVEAGPEGYTSNLVRHLVERAGYRGGGVRSAGGPPRDRASLERALGEWADLLRAEGGTLLADDAGALPR